MDTFCYFVFRFPLCQHFFPHSDFLFDSLVVCRVLLNFHISSSFLVSSCCWFPIPCYFWVCSFIAARKYIWYDFGLLKSAKAWFLAEHVYPGDRFTREPLRRESCLWQMGRSECRSHGVLSLLKSAVSMLIFCLNDVTIFWKGGLCVCVSSKFASLVT